jgi:hypothetical protein
MSCLSHQLDARLQVQRTDHEQTGTNDDGVVLERISTNRRTPGAFSV